MPTASEAGTPPPPQPYPQEGKAGPPPAAVMKAPLPEPAPMQGPPGGVPVTNKAPPPPPPPGGPPYPQLTLKAPPPPYPEASRARRSPSKTLRRELEHLQPSSSGARPVMPVPHVLTIINKAPPPYPPRNAQAEEELHPEAPPPYPPQGKAGGFWCYSFRDVVWERVGAPGATASGSGQPEAPVVIYTHLAQRVGAAGGDAVDRRGAARAARGHPRAPGGSGHPAAGHPDGDLRGRLAAAACRSMRCTSVDVPDPCDVARRAPGGSASSVCGGIPLSALLASGGCRASGRPLSDHSPAPVPVAYASGSGAPEAPVTSGDRIFFDSLPLAPQSPGSQGQETLGSGDHPGNEGHETLETSAVPGELPPAAEPLPESFEPLGSASLRLSM